MKTIAITIDEPTLKKIEHLEEKEMKTRSEIVREALQQFVAERERVRREDREREVFRRLKKKLRRQAAVLIREQAEP